MSADDAPKFKVVFVGDSTVGKTSLIHSYMKQDVKTTSTLGATSTRIETAVDGNRMVLNVWDTAGQESFRNLVPIYAKGSQAGVIVFDQSNATSFEHVKNWYNYMMEQVGEIIICLAANKSDLQSDVDFNEVYSWASEKGMEVIRTSAIEGTNVDTLFDTVAKLLYNSTNGPKEEEPKAEVVLEAAPAEKANEKPKGGCCN